MQRRLLFLGELQDVRSLANEEVQGRIYSEDLGVTDLPSVIKNLEGLIGEIFRDIRIRHIS